MRVVSDTNVLVSSTLFQGSKADAVLDVIEREGVLLLSRAMRDELWAVLARQKFDRFVTVDVRREFLARLDRLAKIVEPTERISVCRDPDDDRVLEAAVAGEADVIVTGDRDLLVLDPFRGIRIVTPRGFLEMVGGE